VPDGNFTASGPPQTRPCCSKISHLLPSLFFLGGTFLAWGSKTRHCCVRSRWAGAQAGPQGRMPQACAPLQEEQGEPCQMKATLAWDPSLELVFQFSCQSGTLEALQGGFIWGQLNRCWMKHREEQHPWAHRDFSPPRCWLSAVEPHGSETAHSTWAGAWARSCPEPPELLICLATSWGVSDLLLHPWTLPWQCTSCIPSSR